MKNRFDLAVIGGGPGGYVAAIRAAQLGKNTVLIEKDAVGGTCMNRGCIPTKFLLQQTKAWAQVKKNRNLVGPVADIGLDWKKVQAEKSRCVIRLVKGVEFLLEKNGVELIKGKAGVKDEHNVLIDLPEEQKDVQAENIILASGSRPAELPFLKPDGDRIITSRDALELENIPKKLVIIGAGAIGLEMGSIFQRLGCEVTIVELMPQILPGAETDIASRLERLLKRQGLAIHTHKKIESKEVQGDQVVLKGTCMTNNTPFECTADKVLSAAGRSPVSDLYEELSSVILEERTGFVKVDPFLKTAAAGVYAIGDLTGGKLLAHKASHEGIIAVENILGAQKTLNCEALPMAVFTDPEFASVGPTEIEARAVSDKIKIGVFSLQASGRALTMGSTEGMVKVIATPDDTIIGAHILAPNASEMLSEITLAIENKLTLSDIGSAVHIHPTLSEATMEASLKACGRAIHVLNS